MNKLQGLMSVWGSNALVDKANTVLEPIGEKKLNNFDIVKLSHTQAVHKIIKEDKALSKKLVTDMKQKRKSTLPLLPKSRSVVTLHKKKEEKEEEVKREISESSDSFTEDTPFDVMQKARMAKLKRQMHKPTDEEDLQKEVEQTVLQAFSKDTQFSQKAIEKYFSQKKMPQKTTR